jgi:hypothetical protein
MRAVLGALRPAGGFVSPCYPAGRFTACSFHVPIIVGRVA